jgi:glycosyltransferase involved in cell wall biosynthesis
MEIVTHAGLRAALDKFEGDLAAGGRLDAERVAALSASAVRWAGIARQTQHLRRLATLLASAGDMGAAIALLRTGTETVPGEVQLALLLSDAISLENDVPAALQALAPCMAQQPPHTRCAKKAIRLHQRLGQFDEALRLARDLADRDPSSAGVLITTLATAEERKEALSKARDVLARRPDEISLINACYRALEKVGAPQAEIADARAFLLERADATGAGQLWRAQLLERGGELDAAMAEVKAGLAAQPGNPPLLKRAAEIALERGYWGQDAGLLNRARSAVPAFSQLAEGITNADRLLEFHGGSLELAARRPRKFAAIKTPECVFEQIVRSAPKPDSSHGRAGVVMAAGSLGGYGAERVLANTFRLLASERRFEWTKFYIADFAKRTSDEFYQPLTGIPGSDVVLLDGACRPSAPLSWIWSGQTLAAARMLEQLNRDRPAIMHASLEPLNVFAGLAALLAGVPRIVLHTHNMRPTELNLKHAARFKGCYQALLARPEVVLAGCARACIDDYIDWLELKDASKTRVVHNGYAFDEIQPVSAGRRAALRQEYGFAPETTVIGAAIRLTESKQPLLWVDAAAAIFERRPDCRFIMFGDGDQRLEVEERIREKNLHPYFILPGRVTDLYDRLPVLDLYMLSSRTEGLPNALIEAQAAGVPVVAFDVGGVRETMIPGETGLLAPELTVDALATAAIGALADRQWRERAAALGPKFVRDAFGLEKMIVTLSEIFADRR